MPCRCTSARVGLPRFTTSRPVVGVDNVVTEHLTFGEALELLRLQNLDGDTPFNITDGFVFADTTFTRTAPPAPHLDTTLPPVLPCCRRRDGVVERSGCRVPPSRTSSHI